MSESVSSILKKIQLLTKADQKKIKLAIDAIIGHDEVPSLKSPTVTDSREEIFYGLICQFMTNKYSSNPTPFKLFKAGNHYPRFKHCITTLDAYLDTLLKTSVIRREKRVTFYNTYLDLVSSDLEGMNVPVGINNLLNTVDRFPGILDKAFPGYVRNGLFMKIITRRQNLSG